MVEWPGYAGFRGREFEIPGLVPGGWSRRAGKLLGELAASAGPGRMEPAGALSFPDSRFRGNGDGGWE